MPPELAYEKEQERRVKQQDGAADECQLIDKDFQEKTIAELKPSCTKCINWRSRSDGSGYCLPRASAELTQMTESYAGSCRFYTTSVEPF